MAETEDDLERIAERILEDEAAAMSLPRPGDPPEYDEEAMRQLELQWMREA